MVSIKHLGFIAEFMMALTLSVEIMMQIFVECLLYVKHLTLTYSLCCKTEGALSHKSHMLSHLIS